jgi:hypothetical protein
MYIKLSGKDGALHRLGKEIQNVFQNLFKQRGKWRRKALEVAPYYSDVAPRATNARKQIICMYDGRMDHGGIADRLRGVISAYDVAKQMGYDFRIYFDHPFRLEDYLEPNLVDWRIAKEELCYNPEDAEAMFCGSNGTWVEPFFQRLWFKKRFREANKQLHVNTNAQLLPRSKRYGELFQELFRPSARLEQALDAQLQRIVTSHHITNLKSQASNLKPQISSLKPHYITISLRFIGLLNDFTERDGKHIAPEEQQRLMDRCVAKIRELYDQRAQGKPVLLTSDSTRFLRYAAERLDFVRYIPGDVVHIDYQDATSDDINMKLFVDMLMISRADEAFLLQTGGMYNSGFPRRAAQITGIPFHHVRF